METGRINDRLSELSQQQSNKTALIEPGRGTRLTWTELHNAVNRTSRRLETASFSAEQTVGLLMENRVAFFIATLGIAKLGATAVPLNHQLTRREQTNQLDSLATTGIITSEQFEQQARDLPIESVLTMDPPACDEVEFLDQLKTGSPISARSNSESDALIMFTSGTTGQPKPVRLTHKNLISHARISADFFDLDTKDTWLAPLPMYHMGGLGPLIRYLVTGHTVIIQDYEFPEILDTIRAFDITALSLVPAQLKRLLKHPSVFPPDSLRLQLLGGGPVPASLAERCLDYDIPLFTSYGATETTSHVAVATPEDIKEDPTNTGARPLNNVSISIDSASKSHQPGEIILNGPMVSPGYAGNNGSREDNGFRTGDAGWLDSDGRLHVEGRLDNMIISGGELVSPDEIETVLEEHPDILEAEVVKQSDEQWGEVPKARIKARKNSSLTPDELDKHCRGALAGYKIPKHWTISPDS